MELQSEITTNISHYFRDDQRDAKSETFKYIILMVLKRPQPLPSMGQEISLQVLTTAGQKSYSNSILYAEKENYRIVLLLIKGSDFWSSHTQSVIAGIIAHYLEWEKWEGEVTKRDPKTCHSQEAALEINQPVNLQKQMSHLHNASQHLQRASMILIFSHKDNKQSAKW